jgi:hypothetical protein
MHVDGKGKHRRSAPDLFRWPLHLTVQLCTFLLFPPRWRP